jgi:transposase
MLPRLCRADPAAFAQAWRHRHHGQSRQPKAAALRRLIKAAGARLWYLPPYSPDLNPIEQTFAKIKHWMRSAQKRTIDDICQHIGSLVTTISPAECSNYFANAGYASIKT